MLEVAATNPRYFAGFAPAEWRVVAAGGYRRGKAEFHDADFLVTHSRLGLDMLHKGAHDGGESLLELLVPPPPHSKKQILNYDAMTIVTMRTPD